MRASPERDTAKTTGVTQSGASWPLSSLGAASQMKDIPTFAQRLAPDTLNRLERAAEHRYVSGDVLWERKRRLAALYMYGFSAEISLTAAYFRCAGFSPNTEIDR